MAKDKKFDFNLDDHFDSDESEVTIVGRHKKRKGWFEDSTGQWWSKKNLMDAVNAELITRDGNTFTIHDPKKRGDDGSKSFIKIKDWDPND